MLPRILWLTRGQRKSQDIGSRAAPEMVPLAVFLFALSRFPHHRAALDDTEGDPCQFFWKTGANTGEESEASHLVRIPTLRVSPTFCLSRKRNRNGQEKKSREDSSRLKQKFLELVCQFATPGGLPFAINQTSRFTAQQKLTLEDFLPLYARNSKKIHTRRLVRGGYRYTLSTVWELAPGQFPGPSLTLQFARVFYP